MSKYENEQKEIKEKLENVINELETTKRNNNNATSFSKLLKEFKGTSELTISTIANLIDKITVFPSEIIINEKGQKEKTQKVEICYRYVGCLIPTTIKFETINYKTRYADRVCEKCNKTFTPTTSTQKYCIDCKNEATKLRRRQRYREKINAQGGNKGYRERSCQLCGKTYKPNSSGQKFCSDCKEQAREILKHEWYIKRKEIRQAKKIEKEDKKQRQSA